MNFKTENRKKKTKTNKTNTHSLMIKNDGKQFSP